MTDEERELTQSSVIESEIPKVEAESENIDPIVIKEIPSSVPSQKKKKLPVILTIVGGTVAIFILVLILVLGGAQETPVKPDVINAKITDDGTAYIPLFDGTGITINDEVKSAVLSKDRKHLVVLLLDGSLYVTDPQQSSKKIIAENAKYIVVRNEGLLYKDKDDILYRVMFDDYTSVKIGTDVAALTAQDTISILYATGDGDIYTMAATSSVGTKVGSFDDTVELEAVSNDGQISVWVNKNDNEITIYLNEGDNRATLGKLETRNNYTYASFSEDQKMAVVTNTESDRMWIKAAGADPVEAKLPHIVKNGSVFTGNGNLLDATADEVKSLYISTESDSGNNLYNITLAGDRERVLSKIKYYTIFNENIVYKDIENNLICGIINGTEVEDERKIASDVDVFEVTDNGKFIYYTKDYEEDNDFATLYCYKLGEEEPIKVASEVGCFSGVDDYGVMGWTYNTYSTDGATVFYFVDLETVGDTYSEHGTLKKWTYGQDNSTKIASEVLTYSVNDSLSSGEVEKDSFMFLKYSSTGEDEKIYANWMYYNGTDTVKIASDIIA